MLELPFGMQEGRLLHVSEVGTGRACACTCPSCGHPLVARKGGRRRHHFAHASGSECAHGVETALHLAAKQLLETERYIHLPAVTLDFEYSHKPSWLIQPESVFRFEEVRLEHRLGDIVPDILMYVNSRPLLIEIAVTHAVDETKLRKITQLGISALEVNLSDFERQPTLETLHEAVIVSARSKRWLYNARVESIRHRLFALCESKAPLHDGAIAYVEDCPRAVRTIHGKSGANVVADCLPCPYCVRAADDSLLCAGKPRIGTYLDLKKAANS